MGILSDLHLLSFIPEYDSKYYSNNSRQEEPDGIILWIPPVRQMLFPEACFALRNKSLGVFSWKM